MKKLRVGVIGIGDISNVYLNNLKKYDAVEVVACASRGLEKAQRKAAEHGIPKAYASGMELIADPDIDIILNLTTPQAHYEYNLAALKAGKHVYTEKPLAMTFEQGRELVSLAKEKGLLIGCAPDTWAASRAAARGLSVTGTSSIIRLRHSSISRVRARCTTWGRTTSPRCSACSVL